MTKPNQDPSYMGPKDGPFRCNKCEYYTEPNQCDKKEMIAHQKQSPAKVDPFGCCNYFKKNLHGA